MPEYDNTNKGVAFNNDYKKADTQPDYKGKGNFSGVDFEFGIWKNPGAKGEFLSFKFEKPYVKEGGKNSKAWQDTRDKFAKNEEEPINLEDIPF